jgi:hypothetical protein
MKNEKKLQKKKKRTQYLQQKIQNQGNLWKPT